ncbi:hypothetical protein CJF42_16220 [Pseudoalteromonas sp. NBT06-2]|uniref:hypothetical protein n=1 Tax=Pseudoalteromonas sp. NBT06-2 TaxID=2025950 RepID=UPI000BD02192|nr:hypothetical protein [Pseudoalteromonas sp. NBT06-2]PAJ73336.1 hypothetical protein CJF42_16220 [Pseudoalteromonas sp. NBT06-2]
MTFLLIPISLFIIVYYVYVSGDPTSRLSIITPSLCVTVGIFFTFLGIAISLNSLDETATSQHAFDALLMGLKSAFWSSVFGLAGSILCKMRLAKRLPDPYDEYAKQTNNIVAAVRENTNNVVYAVNDNSKTVARLLSEQLLKDSKNISQQFNEKTDHVLNQFANSISTLIKQSNTLLIDTNDSVSKNQTLLSSMVTTTQDINSSNIQAMKDFSNLLHKCSSHFKTILENSNESIVDLKQQSEYLRESLSSASNSIVNDFKSAQQLYQSLSKDIKQVQPSMKSLSNLVSDLQVIQQTVEKDHKSNVAAAVVDFKVQFQNVSKAFDELNQSQIKQAHTFFEKLDLSVEQGLQEVAMVYTTGLASILEDKQKELLLAKKHSSEPTLDEVS